MNESPIVEKNLTLGIKTFMRPNCLHRLLKSIRELYPHVAVIVVDDGFEDQFNEQELHDKYDPITYIRTPPDIGLSAGRNVYVLNVETPYGLLLDDDHVFSEQTNLEMMVQGMIDNPHIDILGGMWFDNGTDQLDFFYQFNIHDGILDLDPTPIKTEGNYEFYDIVHNFFIFRPESVKRVLWNPKYKMLEHEDFFLRAKKEGLSVALDRRVAIHHFSERGDSKYCGYRFRDQFRNAFLEDYNLEGLFTPWNQKIHYKYRGYVDQ